MKNWNFRYHTSIVVGFGATAVAAPLIGAFAAYLVQPLPVAQAESSSAVRAMSVVLHPTVQSPAIEQSLMPVPTAQSQLRAVIAITPIPTPLPTMAPAIAPTIIPTIAPHAPESIATAAKMLGFVWQGGNVRVGPNTDETIVGSVDEGDLVELLEQQNDWWRIRTMATEGWVNKTLLIVGESTTAPTEQSVAPAVPVIVEPAAPVVPAPVVSFPATMSNGGNVRSGPGIANSIIGNFDAGTAVDLLDTKSGWWYVRIGSLQGWISGTLLKIPAEALKHWNVPAVVVRPTKPATSNGTVNAAPLQAAAETTSLWSVRTAPGQLAVLPDVSAPNPRLVADAVGPFLRARTRVLRASGVDYLGRLDDVFRGVSYETSKPGVASMSWHKAGRAIDVSQAFNVKGVQGVVFVRDASAPRYYRVLIRCAKQDGSLGNYYGPKQLGARNGFYVDVTTILLSEGFQRIAPEGSVSEAWHYEYRNGLTWSQAMNQLYPTSTLRRIFPSIWR